MTKVTFIRGPIHPPSSALTTAVKAESANRLIWRQDRTNLPSSGRPLGQCQIYFLPLADRQGSMGDFERTFGAGADVDSIIDRFSALEDSYARNEDDKIFKIGKELPVAQSFYDKTGQIWHPSSDPRARLTKAQLSEIDDCAHGVASSFDTFVDKNFAYPSSEVAPIFLKYVQPYLLKIGPSLDAFEAFIGQVVRQSGVPIVFARDTGRLAGYISPTLSTHIIAFPEEAYLARLGGLDLEGPFSEFQPNGGFRMLHQDSYCCFARCGPGQEVLEISAALRSFPIRTVEDWVEAERSDPMLEDRGDNSFGTVAARAAARQKPSRNWSDATEDLLRKQVCSIAACLVPQNSYLTVDLYLGNSKPFLEFYGRGSDWDCEDPAFRVLAVIFGHLDLSAFHGLGWVIELLHDRRFSQEEHMLGRAVLLDIVAALGLDVSAASQALLRADFAYLLQVISPEAYDAASRKKAEDLTIDTARIEALARFGMEEEDLPF